MKNKLASVSLMQIMILVVGIFAFAGLVSGGGEGTPCPTEAGSEPHYCTDALGGNCKPGDTKIEAPCPGGATYVCCKEESPAEEPVAATPASPETPNQAANPKGLGDAPLPFGTLLGATTFLPWKKMGGSCSSYKGNEDILKDIEKDKAKKEGTADEWTDEEYKSAKDEACTERYKEPSTGKAVGASLLSSLMWGGVAFGLAKVLFPALGAGAGLTDAASYAAGAGVFAGYFAGSLATQAGSLTAGEAAALGAGVGLLVGAIVFAATYEEQAQKKKTFTSNPWQAPLGGEHCEECNDEIFGCSEYQCKALGQSCVLVNTEVPGEELCTWENRWDNEPPEIRPWEQALISQDYEYVPYDAVFPEDIGVAIRYKEDSKGCVDAFTPLSFGIMANEAARCKIDFIRKMNFSAMDFDFGGSSTFKYNHTQTMSLPGPSAFAAQNMTLENGGEFELYAKCQDANGNFNPGNMVFKFCVDEGPDTTPPLIITTDPLSGLPIAYNVTSLTAMVYVNEPAECKWSHLDQGYDAMENEMVCSTGLTEFNAQSVYPCEAELTGLKNNEENKFYFRCKDQPVGIADEDRNTNVESYEYVLIGSRPLVIDKVEPEGTIEDSTDTVKVKLTAQTSAGFNEGQAICYYNDEAADAESEYIKFFETDSHLHTQELMLPSGNYEYFVKCIDLAGNADYSNTTFTVYTDKDDPVVVRVYFEENFLKLSTDEDAECAYDNIDCSYNFADGIKMSSTNKVDHFTNWNTNENYYIKCKDVYGNEPLPNQCSITARPFETYYAST